MATPVTPYFAPPFAITGVADEDLLAGTLVGIAGDEVDGKVLVGYPAADGGLVLFCVGRDTLEGADVPLLGPGSVVPVAAGTAITAGAVVMADDEGKAIPAAATTGLNRAGVAFADAADNVVKLYLMPGAVDSDDS